MTRIFRLSYGSFDFEPEDHIRQLIRHADGRALSEAEKRQHHGAEDDVELDRVASAFAKLAIEPGRSGLIDDPSQLLTAQSR